MFGNMFELRPNLSSILLGSPETPSATRLLQMLLGPEYAWHMFSPSEVFKAACLRDAHCRTSGTANVIRMLCRPRWRRLYPKKDRTRFCMQISNLFLLLLVTELVTSNANGGGENA